MTTADTVADPPLPLPTSSRWQPLRLGLIDLFYYDDEQFWFHDGRLLLRGNNGTGKSKVLALTLPFLLDGSTQPRRVEPDADPKKRMDWNLLLGGAHSSTERTGYSWVEFGRTDSAGVDHFTTLGIGLKAAAGRGIVKTWYFTSTRRIGDLRLVDESRTVLSLERLRDDLVGTGQVYSTQSAYRRAVDEALFRLGEERYAALIDLLIQLRQPQLSKRPDEKALSAALTEALAPLDQAIVADVAESFRSLEDERDGVAEAKETLYAAEAFLGHYRAYARVAARRRASGVRTANSAYEQAGRDLLQAQDSLAGAAANIERLATQRQEVEERVGALQGQERALRQSPEMRDADRLNRAGDAATEAENLAVDAREEVERAAAAHRDDESEARDASARNEKAQSETSGDQADAARGAAGAGLSDRHEHIVHDADRAKSALKRRRDQVRYIRGLIDAVEQTRARAAHARRALDAAETESADRSEALQSTRATLDELVTGYRDEVRSYLSGLTTLALRENPDTLADLAEQWARTLTGTSPVPAVLNEAVATALAAASADRAKFDHTAAQLTQELHDVRTEVSDLESGHDPEPPATPGRDRDARTGRAGAPLWWLVDFTGGVPPREHAGIEAALQSAGLLDAWIFPDGTLTCDGDVVLSGAGPEAAVSLGSVLRPAGADDRVDADVVWGVLNRIGWGEASGAAWWVDADGRWGAGPARGAWRKDQAEYLGAGAREAHRRELLEALGQRVSVLEADLAAATAGAAAAAAISERVNAERAAYPERLERELGAAQERAAGAEHELGRAQTKAVSARDLWEQGAAEVSRAGEDLREQADELGVGTTVGDTEAALTAITAYEVSLGRARSSARTAADTSAASMRAAARAAQSAEVHSSRQTDHAKRRANAASLRATFDELHRSVGASVAELQARLAATSAALEESRADTARIGDNQLKAAAAQGRLEENVRDLERRRDEKHTAREDAIDALRDFTVTGLVRVALPEQDTPQAWTITAALELARGIEVQLTAADESDEAWARAQQRVSGASTELSTQMSRHGHQASMEQREDMLLVRVRYGQEEVDIDRLADQLAGDLAERERLLSAREREILENHLVNEVAGHLHELMLTAEEQISRMNDELKVRRTSTGMQLRMRWRERGDGPAGLAQAKKLMIRSDATWTEQDRTAIGDFLQAQIAQVRQADPTGGWQEHLERALDYRRWHTFAVERWQSGQWRSASGPASGGERALAVSVPLFAAASAHYNSASPLAPRLILLDEAFAGVDDDSRAKSLGLLATFDLDVVMTSEREWGCYPQVPGLSIAQLSRREGIDAVGVTRWRWDGTRRERMAEPVTLASGEVPAEEPSLFG